MKKICGNDLSRSESQSDFVDINDYNIFRLLLDALRIK